MIASDASNEGCPMTPVPKAVDEFAVRVTRRKSSQYSGRQSSSSTLAEVRTSRVLTISKILPSDDVPST